MANKKRHRHNRVTDINTKETEANLGGQDWLQFTIPENCALLRCWKYNSFIFNKFCFQEVKESPLQ